MRVRPSDVFENMPIIKVVETYPQLIDYDTEMYDYLYEQWQLCNFDLKVTYPATKTFPHIVVQKGAMASRLPRPGRRAESKRSASASLLEELEERYAATPEHERRAAPGQLDKRQFPPAPFNKTLTGKINPWWGCDMRDTVLTYALNFTFPWSAFPYCFHLDFKLLMLYNQMLWGTLSTT